MKDKDELQTIQNRIYEIRGRKVMLGGKTQFGSLPRRFYVSINKRRNSKLEVTNCDLQFHKDGYQTKSVCLHRTGSSHAK